MKIALLFQVIIQQYFYMSIKRVMCGLKETNWQKESYIEYRGGARNRKEITFNIARRNSTQISENLIQIVFVK